ncbi:MAG: tRNA (adenosine(37)-N6)-threonylcarbamoyltransferase complex transferase subunit TsaD [Elusimicrobiales bacterium]|nr:tRNA (adenosine(37)-N6)-threonylcarbamoyltransferase complex transferase subunit TsaD [Elusimicrobiales bacterium]
MRIIAIETTCDETAASVIENGEIKSDIVFSQVSLHQKYYGIVPELASRAHMEKIAGVVAAALKKSGIEYKKNGKTFFKKVDAVAFARGPGLPGGLLVGRVAGETLSRFFKCPLLGINHLEGHILSYEFENYRINRKLKYPFIAMIVSGGHTELWRARAFGKYKLLGKTRDDAAGEAFDKIAKLLKLGYPGGPIIDALAVKGKANAVKFPRPYMREGHEFSFSGLKTAVAYHLKDNYRLDEKNGFKITKRGINDICASFQEAIVDTLVYKAMSACEKFKLKRLVIGGGVAANSRFRLKMNEEGLKAGVNVCFAGKKYSGDNAAMIGLCAWHKLKSRKSVKNEIDISPNLTISETARPSFANKLRKGKQRVSAQARKRRKI